GGSGTTVFFGGAGATGLGFGLGDGVALVLGFSETSGLADLLGLEEGFCDLVADSEGEGVGPLGTPLVGEGATSSKMNPSPRSWSAGPSKALLIPNAPTTTTAMTAIVASARRNASFPMCFIVAEINEMQMRDAARLRTADIV